MKMNAEEVYRLFDLPWELNEMIYRYLVKMNILQKLEFPSIVPYYHSKLLFKKLKNRDYQFTYDSDNDEYYYIAETSNIRWVVDESNYVKRYKIDQNPFIEYI
jgi:hypothetical protein